MKRARNAASRHQAHLPELAENHRIIEQMEQLEELYRMYTDNPGSYQMTIYEVDKGLNEEIKEVVQALVPSIQKDMTGEYCRQPYNFQKKWSENSYRAFGEYTGVYMGSIQESEAAIVAEGRLCLLCTVK